MKKADAKKRARELSGQIEEHNRRYYIDDNPVISDKEYDDLLKELIDLEERYPDLRHPASPTQRVGTPPASSSKTVKHLSRMLSLDNTYSVEEVKEWYKRVLKGLGTDRVDLTVELKIDGVSASLIYENGIFVRGATRGDAEHGEEITANCRTIRAVPLELAGKNTRTDETLDVRGEIYMNISDFEDLNRHKKDIGEDPFANPRNAASGSVKLLDSRITAQRHLRFFAHSCGTVEGKISFHTQWKFLQGIKERGFCINPHSRFCRSLEDVLDFCREFESRRGELDYEVDGVVIKVNDLEQQQRLGETLKSPRWAVAFKFPAQQVTTTVKGISIQVGRTGILTPVAELDPVACGGVVIARATLHNFDEVERLSVGVGDRVLLERAGDVIPKIVKVVDRGEKRKSVRIPRKCPACGGEIVKDKSEQVAFRCLNTSCPQRLERSLLHFGARAAMDIEGLGEQAVRQMLEKGWIKSLSDIYFLKREKVLELELFKDKKADNLLKSIEGSKTKPLSKLVYALGIINIGEKAAYNLAQEFGSMDALMKAEHADLESICDLGHVMADSVVRFFAQRSTQTMIVELKKAGVNMLEPKTVRTGKLTGKKFVFTGELSDLSRAQASALVMRQGGEVVTSVSKNVDYVVTGRNAGSKVNKAKELGIKQLNAKQFGEMVYG